MNAKAPIDEILKVLDDPEAVYSTTPKGTMQYAQFLAQAGTIAFSPIAWTDMFIAPIHAKGGS
jgi:NitT/TauT family transport system substrate-binding protein